MTRDYLTQTELMVMLAILRLGDEAYGVPISSEILCRTGREVPIASIYHVLGRLETRGLVKSERGESTPERGGRAKTYFKITAQGTTQLHEARSALSQLWRGAPNLKGHFV